MDFLFFFFPLMLFPICTKEITKGNETGTGDGPEWHVKERPVPLKNADSDKGPEGLADQHRDHQRAALTWSGSWRGQAGTGSHRQWGFGPDLRKAPQVSSVCLSPSQAGAYEARTPCSHTADFRRMWVRQLVQGTHSVASTPISASNLAAP